MRSEEIAAPRRPCCLRGLKAVWFDLLTPCTFSLEFGGNGAFDGKKFEPDFIYPVFSPVKLVDYFEEPAVL